MTIMNELIAVVEDEPDISELISINLKKAGFSTKEFSDGKSFLSFLKSNSPDLVILDLMLPDTDGLEICKFLRNNEKHSRCRIIILTAKSEEIDKVLGLELGADDYVTKPFSPKELVARVKAVLRRGNDKLETTKITISSILVIDPEKYEAFVDKNKIELTSTEFRILQILTSHIGKVFTRDEILTKLWGDEKTVVDRTIDVHIKNLRDKLGKAAELIKNIRGVGYKLEV